MSVLLRAFVDELEKIALVRTPLLPLLEKGIDRFAPLPKLAFTTSQYSGPLNPVIRSGASDLPAFRAPNLRRGIQKNSGAVTPMIGPDRGDLVKAGEKTAGPALNIVGEGALTGAGISGLLGGLHGGKAKAKPDSTKFTERHPVLSGVVGGAARGALIGGGLTAAFMLPKVIPEAGQVVGRLGKNVLSAGELAKADLLHRFQAPSAESEKLVSDLFKRTKLGASAPTRGNFMMASDIPAFQSPQLRRGIQKNSGETTMPVSSGSTTDNPALENTGKQAGGMPDGVTANSNDFKPAKLASVTEMSAFVEWLRKHADVSPAVSWNGGTFGGAGARRGVSDIPPFRAPRLDQAIQKAGEAGITPAGQLNKTMRVGAPKVTAPPGPSIADQVKPRGARFGSAMPGAQKGGIGGYGQPSLT